MKALLDTGPWVALLDKSETEHLDCVNWFKTYSGMLLSTEAVLTEVLYLLNFSIKAQSAALDFVLKSAVELVPSNKESLKVSQNLMEKYADLPMDFADATLIALAQEAGVRDVVTLDKKDFGIYRVDGKSFRIIL
jgi:predicted nucleic acid-binding protein